MSPVLYLFLRKIAKFEVGSFCFFFYLKMVFRGPGQVDDHLRNFLVRRFLFGVDLEKGGFFLLGFVGHFLDPYQDAEDFETGLQLHRILFRRSEIKRYNSFRVTNSGSRKLQLI